MMKLTFHALALVFCWAILLNSASAAGNSSSVIEKSSDTTEHTKSAENGIANAQSDGSLPDANQQAPPDDGLGKETEHSKLVRSANSTVQTEAETIKHQEHENATGNEVHHPKLVEKGDVNTQEISYSKDSLSSASPVDGADQKMEHSKPVENDLTTKDIPENHDNTELHGVKDVTLQTIPLGNADDTKLNRTSNKEEEKINTGDVSQIDGSNGYVGLRTPEHNITNGTHWNMRSGSNLSLPRLGLLAVGAAVCFLAHKVT